MRIIQNQSHSVCRRLHLLCPATMLWHNLAATAESCRVRLPRRHTLLIMPWLPHANGRSIGLHLVDIPSFNPQRLALHDGLLNDSRLLDDNGLSLNHDRLSDDRRRGDDALARLQVPRRIPARHGRRTRREALYGTAARDPWGNTEIQRISPPRTVGVITNRRF